MFFDAASLNWSPSPDRHLQQVDENSLTGLLYAKEVGELIAQAKGSGRQLTNLRIEGSELADLLAGAS